MSHTSLLVHCVFSTKDRRPLIAEEIQPRLWSYIGGIARTNGMKALVVGGIADHAHVLLSITATTAVANIQNQKRHHAKQDFAAEWKTILARHGIAEFSRPSGAD